VSKEETFLKKKGETNESLTTTKDRMLQRAEEFEQLKHKVSRKES